MAAKLTILLKKFRPKKIKGNAQKKGEEYDEGRY